MNGCGKMFEEGDCGRHNYLCPSCLDRKDDWERANERVLDELAQTRRELDDAGRQIRILEHRIEAEKAKQEVRAGLTVDDLAHTLDWATQGELRLYKDNEKTGSIGHAPWTYERQAGDVLYDADDEEVAFGGAVLDLLLVAKQKGMIG